MQQMIQVWLEDKPGALMRVVGVLSAKGSNIETLTLQPDQQQPGVSRMTIQADIEPHLKVRVVNEMNRLVNVFHAEDVTAGGGAGTYLAGL